MALSTHYTIKTPGFTESGSDQTPSGGNAIKMGKLRGFTTQFSCSVLWDFVDDDNQNSVGGVVEYKRQGTSTWYKAPNLKWGETGSPVDGSDVKAYVTAIIGLAPNTTYDIRASVSDADGGGVSERTTTFTTRRVPRIPSDASDAHVVTTDAEYNTAVTNANGSEPIYLRATGSPYTSPNLSGKLLNGTYADPLFITNYPGESATLDQLNINDSGSDHIWIDNLTMSNRIRSATAGWGDGLIATRIINNNRDNVSGVGDRQPCRLSSEGVYVADCDFGRTATTDGDIVEVAATCRNLVLIFTNISTGADGLSKGGSGDTIDHMSHDMLFCSIDDIQDDCFELDNQLHGGKVGYCIGGPNIGRTGVSYQGQLMGWCYIYHTQLTGFQTLGGIKHMWKLEGQQGLTWCINNTWIVGNDSNNKGSFQRVFLGEVSSGSGNLEPEGTVFVNNCWGDEENNQTDLAGVSVTVPGDSLFNLPRLIDGNVYGAVNPWDGLTLAQTQTEGHDTNSSTNIDLSAEFDNYPSDVDVGTASPLWPASGSTNVKDSGVTGSSVNGIEPFIGPYYGSVPDAGAHQEWIEFHVGERQFTNFAGNQVNQGYCLPADYVLRDETTATDTKYTDLGLPSSLGSFTATRILMDKDGPTTPTAALVINFRRVAEVDVWDEYLSFLDADHIGSKTITRKWRLEGGSGNGYIRHGLGVTELTSGSNTLLLISAVEDGGIVEATWGITTSDLTTTPTLRRDPWKVAYSLYAEHGTVESGSLPPPNPTGGIVVAIM